MMVTRRPSSLQRPSARRVGVLVQLFATPVIVFVLVLGLACELLAQSNTPPAEERRFDGPTFRAGLTRRGLNEILALHLAEYPPADRTESLMTMRALRMAESADSSRSVAERRVALAEANVLRDNTLGLAFWEAQGFVVRSLQTTRRP